MSELNKLLKHTGASLYAAALEMIQKRYPDELALHSSITPEGLQGGAGRGVYPFAVAKCSEWCTNHRLLTPYRDELEAYSTNHVNNAIRITSACQVQGRVCHTRRVNDDEWIIESESCSYPCTPTDWKEQEQLHWNIMQATGTKPTTDAEILRTAREQYQKEPSA